MNAETGGLQYTEIPERARKAFEAEDPATAVNAALMEEIRAMDIPPPPGNEDGETEEVGGVTVTHRFVEAPGDSEKVTWHLVEAGEGAPIVFLHGLPDSWYQWRHQIPTFAGTNRCIAVDLKGYGQSHKGTGDYRQEGVAEQMLALFDELGLDNVVLVTHDRGSVIADYLGALQPERVKAYVRSEQHLFHFHPELAPQEKLFTSVETRGIFQDPKTLATFAYQSLCTRPLQKDEVVRAVQEFSYDGLGLAVERYFQSSSFRKEWLDRRTRLIDAWCFPVLVLQGADDPRQPREFYEDAHTFLPDGRAHFIDCGHFVPQEAPEETTAAIKDFLGA